MLLINIGSASVAGAFVSVSGGRTSISATVATDIAILSNPATDDFGKAMLDALSATLVSLAKYRNSAPDRVVIFFASPWFASQVRIAKMSRPTPFVITKNLMNDMISRELAAFENTELAGRMAADPLRALESKIVQVKLNGYATASPVGVSAHEFEFSIFLSVAPERLLAAVEEIVHRDYHKPISYGTFLSASFIVARDFFSNQNEYLLVDVGGEITDVTLVRDSAPVQSISFPLGRNYILRKLAAGLGRSIAEAATICTLYAENKVEQGVKDTCTPILKDAKDEWLDAFQKALFAISNELSIPDTVLLSVGTDIAPWFVETIRREEFHQYTLTEKEFKVIVLDAEAFHGALAFAEGVPRNPFIMVEALALTQI